MYVLLLITGITIGTVTVEPLNTFDDLQACEKAAAEQIVIAKALQIRPHIFAASGLGRM